MGLPHDSGSILGIGVISEFVRFLCPNVPLNTDTIDRLQNLFTVSLTHALTQALEALSTARADNTRAGA